MSSIDKERESIFLTFKFPDLKFRIQEVFFIFFIIFFILGDKILFERLQDISYEDNYFNLANISVFIIFPISACILFLEKKNIISKIDLSFYFVLLWFLFTSAWSIDPDLSIRRDFILFIQVSFLYFYTNKFGKEKSLYIVFLVLSLLVIVNVSSVFIFKNAVHQISERGDDLIGAWRGVHYHKNIAGHVAAYSAIIFFHYAFNLRTKIAWLLFFLAVLMLFGTRSKTAIQLAPVAIFVSGYVVYAIDRPRLWKVSRIFFVNILLLVSGLSALYWQNLKDFVFERSAFTGRGELWSIVVDQIQAKYFWWGSGFQAFWGLGYRTPTIYVARSRWIAEAAHSHNGFLELPTYHRYFRIVTCDYSSSFGTIKKHFRPTGSAQFSFVILALVFCIDKSFRS